MQHNPIQRPHPLKDTFYEDVAVKAGPKGKGLGHREFSLLYCEARLLSPSNPDKMDCSLTFFEVLKLLVLTDVSLADTQHLHLTV